jgi:hypothetical protein
VNKPWLLIIDIFAGFLIIFIGLVLYFGLRRETVMKSMYEEITEEFISNVKRSGKITIDDYEKHMERMGIGNSLFNISFEHRYTIFEPEYRYRTLAEIIEEQNKAYPGSNNYHYKEVVTEKPYVYDPINEGELSNETNESVMKKSETTPPDPNHIHGDDCYQGKKHTHDSSCPRTYHGVSSKTIASSTDFEYHSGCGGTMYYYAFVTQCNNCGAYFSYSQTGCSGNCGTYLSTSSGGCSCTGYYTYSCGKTGGRYYDDNGNEVGLSCNSIVVSLAPTHPIQTVYIKEPLITTARATYMDGSIKTVVCTTEFSTSVLKKDQAVILKYSYSINGVSYSKDCEIRVTTLPRHKTCSRGHAYNLNQDASDPGCPYCRQWVDHLSIIEPNTSPIVIIIGTRLQDNGVKLLVTYMDGHTELLTSGYIDNLDRAYLGTKPVTIGYKGATTTVLVTTVCDSMTCDVCGYEYKLYPDGSNPGCPKCIQRVPIFTGNIMEYETINHTEEILKHLYNKGYYILDVNDIFTISVTNKSTNMARQFLKIIYPSLSDRWFMVNKSEYILSR